MQKIDTTVEEQQKEDACWETLSFLRLPADVTSVFQKIKSSLEYHQDRVHDSERTTN